MALGDRLGERLYALRRRTSYSQADLAQLVGVHRNTIDRLEQGRHQGVKAIALARIAQVLHTSVDYLVGMTNVETPYPPQVQRTILLQMGDE